MVLVSAKYPDRISKNAQFVYVIYPLNQYEGESTRVQVPSESLGAILINGTPNTKYQ